MSLNTALNTAQMSLGASAKQISVSARNVAGADDPNYSRKQAPLVTINGVARATGPIRASDSRLFERYLDATSASSREQALLDGYTRLASTVGDTVAGTSLVARSGRMIEALREYANAPNDDNLARAAVVEAKDLTRALNDAARTVEGLRIDTDAEIHSSANRVNKLLSDFEKLNNRITQGTSIGRDVTDDLDQRDTVLAQISNEIGVSTVSRANNDMVLYTDGGVTLFETTARTVEVVSAAPGALHITLDGVRVTGNGSPMPSRSGRLVGLAELHSEVLPEYARQLDNVAFGLISAFQEADPAVPPAVPGPNLAGMFTNAGSIAVPANSVPGAGDRPGWLAASISVNAAIDPAAGGNVRKLRDGINPGYNFNIEGGASFSGHLFGLLDEVGAQQGALGDKTLLDYGASTVGWLEGARQSSDSASKASAAVLQLVSTSLSNARGVDVNDELSLQMQLERSFSASAQLMSVIDNLFKALLAIGR